MTGAFFIACCQKISPSFDQGEGAVKVTAGNTLQCLYDAVNNATVSHV